jgi:integrase/recombinase XerD
LHPKQVRYQAALKPAIYVIPTKSAYLLGGIMLPRFEQFIRERQYLHNVTPATVEWYRHSLAWLPAEAPIADELKTVVLKMREKGRKATGCNSVIRAVNAYLHWDSAGDRKCSPSCQHLRIPALKEPQCVLPAFTAQQIRLLVRWKPKGKYQRRLHQIILFLIDTGARISEALGLRVRDVDLDNMLVTLDGKGRKQRVVPFSLELRKVLFRYISDYNRNPESLLLATRNETALGRRVVLRDVKRLCERLGFEPPARTVHAFRHSFALNYLRKGGSVFHLQRALGHSDLEMTKRYVSLATADLQAVHQRISLLAA